MSFKKIRYHLLIIFILISSASFTQEVEAFYVDSTGRLFVNPGTPVFIYLSTSPDGKDAVKLQSIQPEGMPMYWDGHGPHFLTHLNLYLGRKIRFDLFADGRPPKTSATFDVKQGVQKDEIIYISGVATVELSAIDAHSGVNAIFYSVNNAGFKRYENPVVFDKEGKYTLNFYAIDNVGNKEDVGERVIGVDTTPPVTTLEIEGSQHNEVVSGRSRFLLKATDAVGVRETIYSINDGAETKYSRPISLANLPEGEHTISWYSVDLVGNVEQKQSFVFFVDKTPPMVFEEIIGNTYMVAGREFSSGRSQLRIVAVDNKAGVKEIYYSINNSPFKLYEKPIFLSEITGAVTIRSYAIDNVDNKGESDAEGQYFTMPEIDITGPDIKYSFVGKRLTIRDTLWISSETKVNISAADKGSGLNRIEYRLNDAPAQLYSEAFTVPEAGYHKVSCTAWDNVENLNIANFEFGVDAQAPEIFYNFSVKPHRNELVDGEFIPVYSSGVLLYVAATDDIVGVDNIFISVNGARQRAYTQPLSGFRAGQKHSVIIRAIDKLGNEAEKLVNFKVE